MKYKIKIINPFEGGKSEKDVKMELKVFRGKVFYASNQLDLLTYKLKEKIGALKKIKYQIKEVEKNSKEIYYTDYTLSLINNALAFNKEQLKACIKIAELMDDIGYSYGPDHDAFIEQVILYTNLLN